MNWCGRASIRPTTRRGSSCRSCRCSNGTRSGNRAGTRRSGASGWSSGCGRRRPRWTQAVAPVLESLIDRYELFHGQRNKLEKAIQALSRTDRYRAACEELRKLPGVGLLTAMTFLTEMGDLDRFHNRREVAAYLGLCPSSFESGEANDRKGRITRQGPAPASQSVVPGGLDVAARLGRGQRRLPSHSRRQTGPVEEGDRGGDEALAIVMWHGRKSACGPIDAFRGRGGPHDDCRARVSSARRRPRQRGAA